MFESFVDPETIGAEEISAADPSTATDETHAAATPEGAPGSDIPGGAGQPGPVPYDRFQEVVRARQEYETQLRQYEPYQPLLQVLQASGLPPDQVLQRLYQSPLSAPAPAPIPPSKDEAFQSLLAERGIDAQYADPALVDAYRTGFEAQWDARELREQFAELREFQTQQQQQAARQELQSEMQQAVKQFPVLEASPKLQDQVYARFALMAEANPRYTLAHAAQEVAGTWEELRRGALASHSAAKSADARVPVTAGGGAPPPTEQQNVFGMSREQRAALVREQLDATRNV